jgi:hypothetical protein
MLRWTSVCSFCLIVAEEGSKSKEWCHFSGMRLHDVRKFAVQSPVGMIGFHAFMFSCAKSLSFVFASLLYNCRNLLTNQNFQASRLSYTNVRPSAKLAM